MSELEKLTELFMRFPGIGPRQARRFVYFLLQQDALYRTQLVDAIARVAESVAQCPRCMRFAPLLKGSGECAICTDTTRDTTQLMIVEKDTDIEQMEKSGAYKGHYFVLGGTLSPSGKTRTIAERELFAQLRTRAGELSEVILALSATPDGEYTSEHLAEKITGDTACNGTPITMLGRGLSTGSELEYADGATLIQALKNRA